MVSVTQRIKFKFKEKSAMKELNIKIKKTTSHSIIPRYMSEYSSGADIFANIDKDIQLKTGEIALVPGGFSMSIPEGYEGQVRPRSGLALKHGITVLNAPGTIDSDYRGAVKVILINHGKELFTIKRGERIAQLIMAKVEKASFMPVEELDDTERSDGGFGHTGL